MKNIYGLSLLELEDILIAYNFKKYNARQIYSWLYKKQVQSFSEMTDISKDLRAFLESVFLLDLPIISNKQVAKDGTTKYLLKLADDSYVECVLMHHNYGKSLCVSSQVGCNMGCKFCASGLLKKTRNLEVHEMVGLVMVSEIDLDLKVSHVVVMGTGEPFDNFLNVISFIRIINSPYGLEIGARHITVSTAGVVPMIYEFAKLELQVNLAISLHAPSDVVRDLIMPINKKWKIAEVIKAATDYFLVTGRRITFEYILLKGVNDSVAHANELSALLRGINCYVNLIPYNSVDEFSFKGVDQKGIDLFFDTLKKRGINVITRMKHGDDIDAACGQLRIKKNK